MTYIPEMLPSRRASAERPRRVVFVAYEGVSLLDLAGPLEAFIVANRFGPGAGESPLYECSVASVRGGAIRTADGLPLGTESVLALKGKVIDTLIVPGACAVDDVTRDKALIRWVRNNAGACRRLCSVCIGSFLLAAAQLLDRRRATTHWMHCSLLSERHPAVSVEPDAIFVRDGGIWTSAGVSTGIDMALALIEEDFGHDLAMTVARILVVYLKRSGGQSQYSALLSAQIRSADDVFEKLELWIAEHLTKDLSVEALARRVHMSPRNFARVYLAKRGRTPAKTVEAIRVDAARRLLVQPGSRIKSVAQRCGFNNEEHMRTAFIRSIGIPPREYRGRFTPNQSKERRGISGELRSFRSSAPKRSKAGATSE